MITFTINGKKVQGPRGWTILDVARRHGIEIPSLCHPGVVEPYGTCRLCAVEVDDGKRSRVVISCKYPIKNGITVRTDTDRVNNARRWLVLGLLDELPGSDKLQELARAYGITPGWGWWGSLGPSPFRKWISRAWL